MNSAPNLLPFRRIIRPFLRSSRSSWAINNKSASTSKIPLPPRPTLSESEFTHKFTKGSGPGGQKINKSTSAAQVTHIPTGIVVKSQRTRSRNENLKIAQRILAERIDALEKGADSRREKIRERKSKKKASAEKKSRRKYRALAGEKDDAGAEEIVVAEGIDRSEGRDEDANRSTGSTDMGSESEVKTGAMKE